MKTQPAPVSSGVVHALVLLRRWAGIVAVAVAALALVAWATHTPALGGGFGGHPTMKVNTSLAVVLLAGGALLLARRRDSRVGAAAAACAAAIGLATLAEYVFGVDFGIDQLLVHDPAATWPGRPAANSAVSIIAAGMGLILATRTNRHLVRAGQGLGLLGAGIVGAAVVGFASGTKALYGGHAIAYMSIPAVVALGAVTLATLLIRLDVGVGRALAQADLEGVLLRRLLPLAVLVPVGLGFARDALVRVGADPAFSRWLYTFGVVVVLVVGVAVAAGALGRSSRAAAVTAARLAAVVESSPLAVITLDSAVNVTSWNRAAEAMLGWSADEIVGKRYPLAPAELWPEVEKHFAQAAAGTLHMESERLRKDGSAIWLRFDAAPLRGSAGDVDGILAVITDISERVQAGQALEQMNQQLELRVAERTSQLAAANDELRAFSYSVSHDLRAPLRALSGYSEAMIEDYAPHLDDRARGYLGRIQVAAAKMGELIDGVLVLARVSRAEISRTDVDVTRLAHEIVEQLREAEPHRDVDVDIEPGMAVFADAVLVRQALQNLVENAWKFTRPVERPRIRIGSRAVDDELELFVADNGVGFDERYADKLFQPFQRLHSAGEFDGNGIGLATVGSIVKLHGGRVRAESHGAGARISFTLASHLVERRVAQLATTGGSHA